MVVSRVEQRKSVCYSPDMSAYVKHDSLYILPLLHHQPSFIACADDAAAVIRIHCRPIKTPLFLAATQLIGHFAALPLLLLLLLLFFFFFFFFFYVITLLQMTRLLTTFGLVIIRLIIPQITNMLLTLVASSGECGVYITVRCPSVRPSVSAVDSGSDVQLICCSSGAGGRYWSIAAGAAYRLSIDIRAQQPVLKITRWSRFKERIHFLFILHSNYVATLLCR